MAFSTAPSGMKASGSQTTTYNRPAWQMQGMQDILETSKNAFFPGGQMASTPGYGGPFVAPEHGLFTQGAENLGNMSSPDFTTAKNWMVEGTNWAMHQQRDPNDIRFTNNYAVPDAYTSSNFTPGKVGFNDTLAGYNPNLQAFSAGAAQIGGPQFEASTYNFTPQQVAAQQMAALQRAGIRDVSALTPEQLQAFLIGGPERVSVNPLQQYQMQGPQDVTAGAIGIEKFIDPGVRQKYMDPYMADVIEGERRKARETFGSQLAETGGRAAAAGALGGTRQAVLEGSLRNDFANQMGDITATGLERAYQNAQQQFERDRQAGMTAGQFNVGSKLQADLANQQMAYNTGLQNLNALLGVQQLGTQAGLQASLANQDAALRAALANQQAQLGVQQFGAQQGLQAALANQQADIGFMGMGIDVGRANQQAALQADLANQEQGLKAQISGAELTSGERKLAGQLGQERAIQQAQFQQQANLANQAAQMQAQELGAKLGFEALQTRYQGGLQSGLAEYQQAMDAARLNEQSKQYGYSQAQQAGQFAATHGLDVEKAQQAAIENTVRNNLAAINQFQSGFRDVANLDQQGFQNEFNLNTQRANTGLAQQAMQQRGAELAYQDWVRQQNYPLEVARTMAGMYANVPALGQTTESYTPKQSIWQQIAGFGMMGAGLVGAPFTGGASLAMVGPGMGMATGGGGGGGGGAFNFFGGGGGGGGGNTYGDYDAYGNYTW